MAHYAIIDPDTKLVEFVHVGRDEDDLHPGISDWELYYAPEGKLCRRTSYNTQGGVHNDVGAPFRKNFAGDGFVWDEQRDAFIPPKPLPSWVLDENTCWWEPPTPYPADGGVYLWDEGTLTWQQV